MEPLSSASPHRPRSSYAATAPASTPQVSSPRPVHLSKQSADSDATLRQRSSRAERTMTAVAPESDENDGRDNLSKVEGDEVDLYMLRWGYALVAGSTVCLFLGLWSILIGPLTDTSGLGILDILAKDTHYKYLTVLLCPVTVCFVIVNWWGLKIFRHS
ncbi:hypothetical protein JCM11251_004768 [Rhodosporidiobolus azoricus]